MANERCPSCAAVVRAGDPWCTLCWTDLRATPEPAPARAVAAIPVQPAAAARPALYAVPALDPLSAPLAVLLGEATAPAPAEPETVTWPCVQCGAANSMDLDACATCTTPFGGRVKRIDDVKAQRRKVLMFGLGIVGAFLLLLGVLTFASTGAQDGTTNKAPAGVDFQPVS